MLTLRKPYLLYLGDAALKSDCKTAFGLRDWCRAEGLAHVPFEDFGDVAEFARRRDLAAPLPRPSRTPGRLSGRGARRA